MMRTVLLSGVALSLVGLLSGCGGSDDPDPEPNDDLQAIYLRMPNEGSITLLEGCNVAVGAKAPEDCCNPDKWPEAAGVTEGVDPDKRYKDGEDISKQYNCYVRAKVGDPDFLMRVAIACENGEVALGEGCLPEGVDGWPIPEDKVDAAWQNGNTMSCNCGKTYRGAGCHRAQGQANGDVTKANFLMLKGTCPAVASTTTVAPVTTTTADPVASTTTVAPVTTTTADAPVTTTTADAPVTTTTADPVPNDDLRATYMRMPNEESITLLEGCNVEVGAKAPEDCCNPEKWPEAAGVTEGVDPDKRYKDGEDISKQYNCYVRPKVGDPDFLMRVAIACENGEVALGEGCLPEGVDGWPIPEDKVDAAWQNGNTTDCNCGKTYRGAGCHRAQGQANGNVTKANFLMLNGTCPAFAKANVVVELI